MCVSDVGEAHLDLPPHPSTLSNEMYLHRLFIATGCTLFLLLCSCSGQRGARSVEELAAEIHIVQPDTSVYGTLQTKTIDSLFFTAEYDDEPFSCGFNEAQGEGTILGSLTEGNRFALLITPETKSARHIVNITELSGQWFFDDDDERGFTFTTAGALSSINPKDVSFKKWKIYNGKIILFYTDIESVVRDSRDYQSDTTEIHALTDNHLELSFRGQRISCHRQREAIKVKFNF